MLADSIEYSSSKEAAKVLNDGVARYCTFSSYVHEGAHVDALCLGCTFSDIEWYWGHFNCANLIECRFIRCTFRGTAFADTRFIECSFDSCKFLLDNLGGSCTNDGSKIYGGTVSECSGGEFLFGNGAF